MYKDRSVIEEKVQKCMPVPGANGSKLCASIDLAFSIYIIRLYGSIQEM